MELILWRHAEAEEGSPDLSRSLSRKGQEQAKMMAKWLKPKLPKNSQLWTSEALRSQQTAVALSSRYHTEARLNPDVAYQEVIQWLYESRWQEPLLVVGHQPWIGRVCAHLMGNRQVKEMDWSFKKGAVWWFEMKPDCEGVRAKLRVVMPPSLLLKA